MLDTYAHLKTAIACALMRDDPDIDALAADWITLCEASIRRLLKSQTDVVRAYIGDGGANERYENLPGDYYELVATPRINNTLNGGDGRIEYITPRLMDGLWVNPQVGDPKFFTIVGPQIEFYPQPNGAQIEIAYRQGVIPLATAAGGVNPLLLEAPDLYLYGSLIHSAPLLREDERVQMWQGFYTTAIADFNLAHMRKRFSGGPLVMRPRRSIG